MPLRIPAPAKINLSLHITGKRADGYHLLDSLVAFTEFGDELEFSEAPDVSLAVKGEFSHELAQDSANNLVLKAAVALRETMSVSDGVHITLSKAIPVGAGLGGGSADAAAVLHELCRFWELKISDTALNEIALRLGSDVPVCLHSRMAYMRGIGEQITPLPLSANIWIVLVNPKQPLLTKAVFGNYSGTFSPEGKIAGSIDSFEALLAAMEDSHNALEKPAIGLLPVIQTILDTIKATEGCRIARMSGSGATCFGLYASEAQAQAACKSIQSKQPGWWTTASHLLYESPVV
jgi:4-diphosphocytidyl-2-C-methyl-D-erythritol kinase